MNTTFRNRLVFKWPLFESKQILAFVVTALFMSLFVLEFSRILTMPEQDGQVNHAAPAQAVKIAAASSQST